MSLSKWGKTDNTGKKDLTNGIVRYESPPCYSPLFPRYSPLFTAIPSLFTAIPSLFTAIHRYSLAIFPPIFEGHVHNFPKMKSCTMFIYDKNPFSTSSNPNPKLIWNLIKYYIYWYFPPWDFVCCCLWGFVHCPWAGAPESDWALRGLRAEVVHVLVHTFHRTHGVFSIDIASLRVNRRDWR